MASTNEAASGSTSSARALDVQETHPPAGPLPSKRGEIGYQEQIHGRPQVQEAEAASILERHPADTPLAGNLSSPSSSPSSAVPAIPTSSAPASAPSTPLNDSSSTHSMGKRSIASLLKPKNVPTYGGVRLTTILILLFQLSLLGGTIAGWVLAVKLLGRRQSRQSGDDDPNGQINGGTTSIFVYVAFGITVLVQLLFLERRIFRVRAERYGYLHPGEMLPTSLRRVSSRRSTAMGIAPWHRPPLPTYAAALAQSGVGTGDVEDSAIAPPPPPAYGHTRGSRLLLAGFLRTSLRAQARELEVDRRSRMSERSDRPVSFMSRDEEWEERRDAERALQVEEALARLEEGHQEGPVRVSETQRR